MNTTNTETPDGVVAAQIVSTLRREKLLAEDRLKGLEEKLALGAIDAGDWRLLAELDDKKAKEEHDDSEG